MVNFKKKIAILMSLMLSAILLVGCGGKTKSPTDYVNDYFKEVKSGTESKIAQQMISSQLSGEDMPKEAVDAIIDMLGKLEVTPKDEKIDGDKATVNVAIKGVSFKTVLSTYLVNVMGQAMSMSNLSEEEVEKKVMELLIKTIKETPAEERTGVSNLTKSGDEWKVVEDNSLQEAVFGFTEKDLEAFGK